MMQIRNEERERPKFSFLPSVERANLIQASGVEWSREREGKESGRESEREREREREMHLHQGRALCVRVSCGRKARRTHTSTPRGSRWMKRGFSFFQWKAVATGLMRGPVCEELKIQAFIVWLLREREKRGLTKTFQPPLYVNPPREWLQHATAGLIGRLVRIRCTQTKYTTVIASWERERERERERKRERHTLTLCVPNLKLGPVQSGEWREKSEEGLLLLFPSVTHLVGCISPPLFSRVFDSFIHFQTLIPLPLYNFFHPKFSLGFTCVSVFARGPKLRSIPLSLSSPSLIFLSLPTSFELLCTVFCSLCVFNESIFTQWSQSLNCSLPKAQDTEKRKRAREEQTHEWGKVSEQRGISAASCSLRHHSMSFCSSAPSPLFLSPSFYSLSLSHLPNWGEGTRSTKRIKEVWFASSGSESSCKMSTCHLLPSVWWVWI